MRNGYYFNENGEIVPTKVYIVYGAPASGKTTYVKKHKKAGDLVIDLDYIKQAVSLEGKTEAPDNLLDIALAMRECAYGLIEERKVDCKTVWVVAGLPSRKQRLELKERLKAELIFMDASQEECIRRACQDPERADKEKAEAIIKKYFEMYKP